MVKEYGKKMEIFKTQIPSKASMLMTKKVDMVFIIGIQAIYIKETFLMIFAMAMEKCSGMMEAFIKECGKKDTSVVKEKLYYWSYIFKVKFAVGFESRYGIFEKNILVEDIEK